MTSLRLRIATWTFILLPTVGHAQVLHMHHVIQSLALMSFILSMRMGSSERLKKLLTVFHLGSSCVRIQNWFSFSYLSSLSSFLPTFLLFFPKQPRAIFLKAIPPAFDENLEVCHNNN